MAASSGDVPAVSTLDHFPLLLPDRALKHVLSYLSLPLRSVLRLCRRLRDMEQLAPQQVHSIRLLYCEGNFILLATESKSDEERILSKRRADLEGVSLGSIVNEEEEVAEDFDYSKCMYAFRFNSEERIHMLHNFLRSLDGTTIHNFELDTWVSPYFHDDILDILPSLSIENLTLHSTTEEKSLFDTMQIKDSQKKNKKKI
ncbi:hypothetical protein PENTCL1PPCAC_23232 [Pristionchus entomophagus]|uniref:F-box domain-containing protein n=1 Tax=Pristionchus entomophagus TaxID=358040 RepID=A0AAV5U3T1_9BILA|nr:hypothetical protein PENTCL1PPCAC_23232 [Pristionchus entomophagus]